VNLVLFVVGVVGMTHIIVDSKISAPVDEWIRPRSPWLADLMDCYQCAGFWCGVALGLALLSYRPCTVFAAGSLNDLIGGEGVPELVGAGVDAALLSQPLEPAANGVGRPGFAVRIAEHRPFRVLEGQPAANLVGALRL